MEIIVLVQYYLVFLLGDKFHTPYAYVRIITTFNQGGVADEARATGVRFSAAGEMSSRRHPNSS